MAHLPLPLTRARPYRICQCQFCKCLEFTTLTHWCGEYAAAVLGRVFLASVALDIRTVELWLPGSFGRVMMCASVCLSTCTGLRQQVFNIVVKIFVLTRV